MECDYDDTARTRASEEGLFVEISAAPSVAGAIKLTHKGVIDKTDAVVCELTGTGLKSHEEYSKVFENHSKSSQISIRCFRF
jgi:threonine synthase